MYSSPPLLTMHPSINSIVFSLHYFNLGEDYVFHNITSSITIFLAFTHSYSLCTCNNIRSTVTNTISRQQKSHNYDHTIATTTSDMQSGIISSTSDL